MGKVFSAIEGVGPRSAWGAIGTEDVDRRHLAYQYYRYNEIPFANNRDTRVYIRFSAAGSSTGGTGSGPYATPYLVRHRGDAKILIAALIAAMPVGSNLGIMFFMDEVIFGQIANTDQSFIIDKDHVSIGWTSDGIRRPEVTGFVPLTGGGPAGSSHIGTSMGLVGTTITIDNSADNPGVVVYWVRGRVVGSTSRDDYDAIPGRIAADATDCAANGWSFFSDGSTITVNCGSGPNAWDPDTLEGTCDTGGGFIFKNVTDCSCDNIICGGNGMNAPFTAGGGQAIRFEGVGTNTIVRRNIKQIYGHYHVGGHFVTGGSGTGGISTVHDSEFGYHTWDANGGGDADIAFNGDGGHEWGRYNCRQRRGGLDMTDAYFALAAHAVMTANINATLNPHGLASGTPYGHATGAAVASYFFERGCTYAAESGQPIVADHMCANVPAVTDKDSQLSYIGGSCDRTVTAMSISPDAMWGIHESLRQTIKCPPPSGFFWNVYGAGALKGIFINLDQVFEAVAGTWTSKSIRVMTNGTSDFRIIHGRRRLTGVNCNSINWLFSTGLNTCPQHNGLESLESAIGAANYGFTTSDGSAHFTEGSPGTGGILGLGAYGIQASQINGLTGVVTLLAAADWTTAAGVHSSCQNVAQALPANIYCWRDLLGQRRNPAWNLRSLGPIEANPSGSNTAMSRIDRRGTFRDPRV